MNCGDDASVNEMLNSCAVSFTSDFPGGHDKDIPGELQERMPFLPEIAAGLCQGLKIAQEHRLRLQQEIKTILKRQTFSVPSTSSSDATYTGKAGL